MSSKAKLLAGVVALGIVDAVVLGLPVIALILVYVILDKPPWFARLVREVYGE